MIERTMETSLLEDIRRFVEELGVHEGPCEFPDPHGGCKRHAVTFEARRGDAILAVREIERSLGKILLSVADMTRPASPRDRHD